MAESVNSEAENFVTSIKEETPSFNADAETPQNSEQIIKFESNEESIVDISYNDLLELYKNSKGYIVSLESKLTNYEAELISLKNAASDFHKQRDPTYREKVLFRKLAMKEQEIQDYVSQINELKAAQIPSMMTLKSTLLDPAVNIIIQKLKTELSNTKASLEETQNELNAWKFTPDSNTGKRLMAKCRLLHHENEELGKMISSGRVAKLEGELALQKSFSEEVKKSQFELDELLQDLDEDVEGMQGTIYYLQQELKKSKDKIIDLEKKNRQLRDTANQSENNNFDDNDMFKVDEESSNDSSCLILKVNPEEEYATMLNMEEETNTASKEEAFDFKNKRSNEDSFKNVPPKKQKRNINQEFTDVKSKS